MVLVSGGFDLGCLRWWALVREEEARELRVLIGSEGWFLVKMGERGMVKVVGLRATNSEDEAKSNFEMRNIRERSDEAAMYGWDFREREREREREWESEE